MFSASVLSTIVAVIGLLVWGVRYLISRNDKELIQARTENKNAKTIIYRVLKANSASSTDEHDDELRDKYNR